MLVKMVTAVVLAKVARVKFWPIICACTTRSLLVSMPLATHDIPMEDFFFAPDTPFKYKVAQKGPFEGSRVSGAGGHLFGQKCFRNTMLLTLFGICHYNYASYIKAKYMYLIVFV